MKIIWSKAQRYINLFLTGTKLAADMPTKTALYGILRLQDRIARKFVQDSECMRKCLAHAGLYAKLAHLAEEIVESEEYERRLMQDMSEKLHIEDIKAPKVENSTTCS
jgi:hypothetical protein